MRTILLAYEREQDLSRVETLLQTRGHRVLRARTGIEAIEIARSESPHIVLSDVMLPRLDGFALCRRLKEDPVLQHLPVLLHSFRVEGTKYEAFASEVGAERFLPRGSTLEEVATAVEAFEPGSGTTRMPAIMPELLQQREEALQRLADLEKRLRVAEAANQQLAADERDARERLEREARQRAEAAEADAENLRQLQARIDELEEVQRQLSTAEKQARGVVAESQAGLARVALLEKRLTELQTGRAKAYADAEDALRVFAAQPLPTWLCEMDSGKLRAVSDSAAAFVGSEPSDLIKRRIFDFLPGLDFKVDPSQPASLRLAGEAGQVVDLEVWRQSVSFSGRACWLVTTRDVSAQRAAEVDRAQLEIKAKAIELLPLASSVVDGNGNFVYGNAAFSRLIGVDADALKERTLAELEVESSGESTIRTALAGESGLTVHEARWHRPDGTVFDAEVSTTFLNDTPGWRLLSVRDISTRTDQNARAEREQRCLIELIDLAQQVTGYTDLEISGRAVDLAARSTSSKSGAFFQVNADGSELELHARTGTESETGYVETADRRWRGVPPSGSALKECLASGHPVVRDTEEGTGALKQAGLPELLTRQVVTPVLDGSRVVGILLLADKAGAYDEADRRLAALVADCAWKALRRRRSNAEVLSAMDHMERVMLGSVETLANLADVQDAGKRGRARRVSDLAASLGASLGLPGHAVRGLRVIGQLLDIGMLQIPKEILWRPGQLTAAEFELVKTHVAHGYESLRRIEFPWPVADAVLQHHECVDGTGYPQGLSGDEILLEARIAAVADAVDAMLSPRPQRDALSLRACLEELQTQAGRRYDARVVKACVKLLQEREAKAEGEAAESQIA
jgi:PAS domain S-box-containing protein